MFHLKLTKSRSYTGLIHASAERPDVFVDDLATAHAAVASGYFEILPNGTDTTAPPESPTGTIVAIDAMNANQLRAYMKKNALEIDLPSGTKAEELRTAIAAALAAKATEGDDNAALSFLSQADDTADKPLEIGDTTPLSTLGIDAAYNQQGD